MVWKELEAAFHLGKQRQVKEGRVELLKEEHPWPQAAGTQNIVQEMPWGTSTAVQLHHHPHSWAEKKKLQIDWKLGKMSSQKGW